MNEAAENRTAAITAMAAAMLTTGSVNRPMTGI